MALTDAETQIVIAEFVVFVCMTVLFSLLSLESKDVKKIIFNVLAMVMWFMMGLFNLAVSPVDNVLQVAPAVLFFGLGLLWLVFLFRSVIDSMKLAYEKKMSVDPL